jgi:hypothetical protein
MTKVARGYGGNGGGAAVAEIEAVETLEQAAIRYASITRRVKILQEPLEGLRERLLAGLADGETIGPVTRKDVSRLTSTEALEDALKARRLWSTVSKEVLVVAKLRALAKGNADLESEIEELGGVETATRLEVADKE